MKKVAVVLLNLGGPDCKNAIRPFLMNFFMDKNIIRFPVPFRCLIAWGIAFSRSRREAKDSYKELGDKSPLLNNSIAQAKAVEKLLKDDTSVKYKTFISMRYWHPMSDQVVREVRDWGADEIVLLPLYPQFSTTTTWSSMGVWQKAMHYAGMTTPVSTICCYPFNKGFIKASVENIKDQLKQARKDGHEKIRVLFSAHGLPEKFVRDGDPYQWQCEQSARKIVDALGEENLDWTICYQSRVGRMKWIGPSTEEEIERAAEDGTAIIIYPHAFTQEHVETLVELDIEYKEVAEEKGLHGYYRAQTVGTHPAFIEGLADLVRKHMGSQKIKAEGGKPLCPSGSKQCCMQYQDNLIFSKELEEARKAEDKKTPEQDNKKAA